MFQVIIGGSRRRPVKARVGLCAPRNDQRQMKPRETPVFAKWKPRLALLLFAAYFVSCSSGPGVESATQTPASSNSGLPASNTPKAIPVVSATIVKIYPHDPKAFTQGLEFNNGHLYESTGRTGQSTLRECVLETGKVPRSVSLPAQEFGEGLTIFHGKIYQLT